ncbi:protein transport protein SEC31 homolog B [Coffea eugenioides]|uniref:protein transport protein SEC31 homolog B n=1 Tax=Coffea eugenioides TaxID=49369 RepID=UPI000F614049|nr:protein transport protein SEC31 homolog B [Coffea eugenioides]
MASIKVVNRSACAAFAPEGPYLAAGTMAGAVDLQFSSLANLDIFELDFALDDRQLVLTGSAPSTERFNRLSWGKGPSDSEEFSLGLIAGGLVDGNIGLWNPKRLISAQSGNRSSEAIGAFLCHLSRHRGPVRGLEFSTHTPNLIASGADEGDVCIWDVINPTEPTHFPPLRGSSSATQGEISFLSWNCVTSHILASTSYNGTTVVWDLRRQKPVLSFADSARRRCSVLQWNPDAATQLIVASDEDSSPSLRLWDLRNVMSPNKELVGHTKGVIAMSWCPIDSSYVLTCAKDNRTICWDVGSGEIISELPAGTNWNFDIHWYPRIPGVISASSFDGKIGIYNVEGCGRYGTGEGDLSTAPLKAPKWYKRKAGVSFGFGGKLVSFNSTEAPAGSSEVYVHSLVTEHSLATRSSEFQAAIQNGERSSLRLLCEKKFQESESEDEKEIWGFLKVMFEDDGTARSNLLSHLGFSPPSEETDAVENHISEQVNALDLNESGKDKDGFTTTKETVMYANDNGEDFFNNLPSPRADTPVSTSESKFIGGDSVPVEEGSQQETEQEDIDDSSFDDAVQRALVVGDYKGAVAQCISASKMADALVIAHAGGSALWESTRNKYLKTSHSPYLKVVAAMVTKDLTSLVSMRPLKSWKETIALLCSFAQPDEWTFLCDTLASRLMAAGYTLPATLCFICAGNIDKTVEIWSRILASEHDGKSYVELLQDLMEKTVVLALATGQKQFSASIYKLIEKYAEILASQGLLSTAMEYLKLLGTEELSPELKVLQDRIALSIEPDKDVQQPEPGPVHGFDQPSYGGVDASRSFYPEPTPPQLQASVPSSPYADNNYPQPLASSFSRGYSPAPTYQTTHQPSIQQPNMFMPSQVAQPSQGNFAPPPVNTQPPLRPFVPSDTPMLRNVEKYQQPTLGSQLYPGPANPNYQVGPQMVRPPPVQKMPQVVAPSPASRGFVPISNSGIQRPGMNQIQPPSPNQAAPVQTPVTSPGPPPTVQTADTSNVPAQQKPVIATLTRLFNETSEAFGGSRATAGKRREIEDNSRKLGALFMKLNSGDISKNAAEKLIQLCQALDNGDFSTALQIQVQLTTSDWDECNFWLATLKRMIKTRQNFR